MKKEEIGIHITNWLKSYCDKSKMNGFVVGISGGIDSALTSTLCAKTSLPTYVISMPIHQKSNQLARANAHIEWLQNNFENVRKIEIDLTNSFEALKNSLPEDIHDDLSMANTRSRLRMTTLYAFSTHYRMLVAGTGNKIEDFGVGFYTKYGDGGVDISPIADLTKTQVFELSAHFGINKEILDAPPTDGLWEDDRTDEEQMGASYPELEWAMDFLENSNNSRAHLSEREQQILEIYKGFHQKNRHKMIPIPICEIPKEFI